MPPPRLHRLPLKDWENLDSIKRVKVTHAVYPRLMEFLATGRENLDTTLTISRLLPPFSRSCLCYQRGMPCPAPPKGGGNLDYTLKISVTPAVYPRLMEILATQWQVAALSTPAGQGKRAPVAAIREPGLSLTEKCPESWRTWTSLKKRKAKRASQPITANLTRICPSKSGQIS